MAKIRVVEAHTLGPKEALRRLQKKTGDLISQFNKEVKNFTYSWSGSRCTFSGSAKGRSASGAVLVGSNSVTVEVDINPLRFYERPFAEQKLREHLQKILR